MRRFLLSRITNFSTRFHLPLSKFSYFPSPLFPPSPLKALIFPPLLPSFHISSYNFQTSYNFHPLLLFHHPALPSGVSCIPFSLSRHLFDLPSYLPPKYIRFLLSPNCSSEHLCLSLPPFSFPKGTTRSFPPLSPKTTLSVSTTPWKSSVFRVLILSVSYRVFVKRFFAWKPFLFIFLFVCFLFFLFL